MQDFLSQVMNHYFQRATKEALTREFPGSVDMKDVYLVENCSYKLEILVVERGKLNNLCYFYSLFKIMIFFVNTYFLKYFRNKNSIFQFLYFLLSGV